MDTFERELESLINRYSKENDSNTPDFILAQYIVGCLTAFNNAVQRREAWYGIAVDDDGQRYRSLLDSLPPDIIASIKE
jgi:hypothetical protein